MACREKTAKIQFLKTFKGIGQKYARNMMMDVYDKDFRDSIAIDARIDGILDKLGLKLSRMPPRRHSAWAQPGVHD